MKICADSYQVNQTGTYWYHSHTKGQYPDGWRGQFIVHDPENPYRDQYDEEVALTLSDWYHDEMPGLIDFFISYANPTGAEPVPNSALINDTQNLTVSIEPGKTYFFRMTNIGAFAGQYFWIEGHEMTIIELDGVYTEPAKAKMIYLTAAQRCGFLVTARKDASANFAMVGSMDEVCVANCAPPGRWLLTTHAGSFRCGAGRLKPECDWLACLRQLQTQPDTCLDR